MSQDKINKWIKRNSHNTGHFLVPGMPTRPFFSEIFMLSFSFCFFLSGLDFHVLSGSAKWLNFNLKCASIPVCILGGEVRIADLGQNGMGLNLLILPLWPHSECKEPSVSI